MYLLPRLPLLSGVLLLAAAPLAAAESPLPDPVAPAVIGRPLDQIGPARATRPKPASTKAAAQPATARKVASRTTAAQPLVLAPAAAQDAQGMLHRPKQAVDDRADPRMRLDDVGTGTNFARKPLGEGAYFADKHRLAVRQYYAQHPVSGPGAGWKIGEPVPRGAKVAELPRGLLASLPAVPPGHRYLQLGGEVVLIAAGSKMVVDGISRRPR
jgi:hypothetical protein